MLAVLIGDPQMPIATTVPCAGVAGTCAYDPAARFALADANNALTGRVALSYTFGSGMLLYASYNRGYRAGAVNGGGYTSSSGIGYIEPERVNAYEIGIKGRAGGRLLTYAASAFYYDYSNQQLQDTRAGPVSFLVNAPSSEVYGLEIETTLRPTDGFRVNASLGWLHSKYKELTLQGADLSGNSLPFAPIPRRTFYRWYDRFFEGGPEALEDRPSAPSRAWNRIGDNIQQQIVEMALDYSELSPRERAVRFTDERHYYVSEATVYRPLKVHDLFTSPAYVVIKAADQFRTKTTRPNEMWQTDFTYFKIIGWGWMYLSSSTTSRATSSPRSCAPTCGPRTSPTPWTSLSRSRAATAPRCCTSLGCCRIMARVTSRANWRNISRPGR